MLENNNCFLKKKILVYGLGKSGIASYKFLKNKNKLYLFDDKKISIKNSDIKKKFIKFKNLRKENFDYIILSPGINIDKCLLKKYLSKNKKKLEKI